MSSEIDLKEIIGQAMHGLLTVEGVDEHEDLQSFVDDYSNKLFELLQLCKEDTIDPETVDNYVQIHVTGIAREIAKFLPSEESD